LNKLAAFSPGPYARGQLFCSKPDLNVPTNSPLAYFAQKV